MVDPIDRQSKVKYNRFMVELSSTNTINLETLATNFEIDVQAVNERDGMYIKQGSNIIKRPYKLSDTSRQVNKKNPDNAEGFTKVEYAAKSDLVKFINPPEQIPEGCWCTVEKCGRIGPDGHSKECSFPHKLILNLTLKGFLDCYFSEDKKYSGLLYNADYIKDIIDIFSNDIDHSDQYISHSNYNQPSIEKLLIAIANSITMRGHKFLFKNYGKTSVDSSKILTIIKYQDLKKVTGLKKQNEKKFVHGAVIIQYSKIYNGELKKSSIRVFATGAITITCIYGQDEYYKQMILLVIDRIRNAVSQGKEGGSFNIKNEIMIGGANGKVSLIHQKTKGNVEEI
jgi:hypothetical protein